MRMAKTLRATVTMRQEPMLAVVSCRSRTKSNAWPEALGPSSWFSSRALITSHGSSRRALAPPGQGQGCQRAGAGLSATDSLSLSSETSWTCGQRWRLPLLRPCRGPCGRDRTARGLVLRASVARLPPSGPAWAPHHPHKAQAFSPASPACLISSRASRTSKRHPGLASRPLHLPGPSLQTPSLLPSPG